MDYKGFIKLWKRAEPDVSFRKVWKRIEHTIERDKGGTVVLRRFWPEMLVTAAVAAAAFVILFVNYSKQMELKDYYQMYYSTEYIYDQVKY